MQVQEMVPYVNKAADREKLSNFTLMKGGNIEYVAWCQVRPIHEVTLAL